MVNAYKYGFAWLGSLMSIMVFVATESSHLVDAKAITRLIVLVVFVRSAPSKLICAKPSLWWTAKKLLSSHVFHVIYHHISTHSII